MSQPIVIFVSRLAESLNIGEEVCFDKLQESLINKYNKSWSSTGKLFLSPPYILSPPYKSKFVVYVENEMTYSSEDFYENTYSAAKLYQCYTPWFVNNEFVFPIFEEQSEEYSENITEPTKGYTILPAKIVIPAGEYTKKDLLGFIKML